MAGLLVLGASGLLGHAVVDQAREAGASLTAVGRNVPDSWTAQDVWRELDLSTSGAASMADLLATVSPSAIINCVGRTVGSREALGRANVLTVGVLLDAIGRWGGAARIVHVGSAAQYAPSAEGSVTREDDPLEPQTPYAVTKLAAEQLVQLAIRDGEADAVVARVFNPIGPGMPESSMPGRAARAIGTAVANGANTVTMGSLESYRDFVDTRDIAAALVLLAQADRLEHSAFNVASGEARQARDIVHRIATMAGFDGTVLETAPPSPRSGGLGWQRADISRLTALGWRPKHDLAASISALVESVVSGLMPEKGR